MSKKTETLQIEGMSCGHCVNAVQAALGEVEGVEVQAVEIGSAHVHYDTETIPRTTLVEAIEDMGYAVST